MEFSLEIESQVDKDDITNFDEIKVQVIEKLEALKNTPAVHEVNPLIYHVDVAAMYPNIILSNRLQPVAIVNEQICAGCVHNKEENQCKRQMQWQWKGEYFPLKQREFEEVKRQIEREQANAEYMPKDKMNELIKKRVKTYCQNHYRKIHINEVELKNDTVCMRENSFYVDTVRAFRDRRYDFKRLLK
jgi:DNA polymerase epsilon subunit 1